MVVDLPAPFGPRKPVTFPGCTVKVNESTASLSPYRLLKPRASIINPPIVSPDYLPQPYEHGGVLPSSQRINPCPGTTTFEVRHSEMRPRPRSEPPGSRDQVGLAGATSCGGRGSTAVGTAAIC